MRTREITDAQTGVEKLVPLWRCKPWCGHEYPRIHVPIAEISLDRTGGQMISGKMPYCRDELTV